MLQDEEEQQYGVQDLRQLVAGGRIHFQGSTRPQGNDPLLFVEGSRNINILARPMPLPPPPLLLSAPSPHPPPHHSYHQYYDNLSNNINSILGGQNLQVGGGAGVGVVLMESTPPALPPPPPPPPPCHGRGHDHHYGWNTNINNVVSDLQQGDGNINNCRWPRQETLTLLEIRSRLDPKFKEANHKAPLWDQLSRIMGEEHGYYRSGKKCREKFENLYKYYKKTREGKAGRQDGKHYRFFRQLEALYGETISTSLFPPQLINTTTTNPTTDEDLDDDQEPALSTNFSNTNTNTTSQEFDHYPTTTSSSENNNNMYIKMNNNIDDQDLSAVACSMMMNMRSGKSLAAHDDHQVIKNSKKKINWKVEKVKGFVELEMRRLAEAQEAWMERMERMIGDKEKESMCREEEWTKQEVARLDRQHEAWAKRRAWMEARDASFLDTFKKYTAAKFTHIAAGAGNNTTSCFHPDIISNNNLSCVGSSSRLAEAHEGQELWSSYELKKKEKIMREENN